MEVRMIAEARDGSCIAVLRRAVVTGMLKRTGGAVGGACCGQEAAQTDGFERAVVKMSLKRMVSTCRKGLREVDLIRFSAFVTTVS